MKKKLYRGLVFLLFFLLFGFLTSLKAEALVTGMVLEGDSIPVNFNCNDFNDPVYGYLSSDHANTTPILDIHCSDFTGLIYANSSLPIGVSVDLIEASGSAGAGRHSCDGKTYDECLIRMDGGAVTGTLFIQSSIAPTPLPSQGTINITKTVINDNGGVKSVSDFPLFVNGTLVISGMTNVFPASVSYAVTETSDPNYTQTFSGDCDINGHLNLNPGNNKFCIVTNDDIGQLVNNHGGGAVGSSVVAVGSTGTVNVLKIIINDNGGTKTIADFPLFVNGTQVISGATNTFPAPAVSYAITETSDPNYTQTFSGDCDINGHLNLNPGNNKFCIVTNDDIGQTAIVLAPVAPLIDLVKVPSPLALLTGPGPVTYTYTLNNIGLVPVGDIILVGDACSPIVFVSGDKNFNAKLDLDESWVYSCSKILTRTETSSVTVSGTANGISAVDIANATVVVSPSEIIPGLPNTGAVVPPLIHITKVPNPLALPSGGGRVTYTETINNPGKVALSRVHLSDDKCAPVKYISGDINKNSKLDISEKWIYECQAFLNKTTMNTVTASGVANGLVARDFAVVTVAVADFLLPKSANIFQDMNFLLLATIFFVILLILFLLFHYKRK